MDTHQATRWTQFITPLSGIIAVTCFFLPWVERGAPFVPTIDEDGRRTNPLWRCGTLNCCLESTAVGEFRFANADLVFVSMTYSLSGDYTQPTNNHYKCKKSNPFHYEYSGVKPNPLGLGYRFPAKGVIPVK